MTAALPKISLLIPVYNQEAWIEACVRSALAQTYPNLEVIVSDNASTDGTERVVAGLLSDPRLIYSRSPMNVGRVRNYHRLLHELATGDFCMVIDGDDMLINNDYVAIAAKILIDNPDVVLAFGKVVQGPSLDGAVPSNDNVQLPRVMDGNAFFLSHPPFGTVGIYHLTALYRRRDAIAAGMYDRDVLSVDYDGFYRMILGRKLAFTDEFSGFWRQHGSNASHRYDLDVLCRNFDALVEPYRLAKERGTASTSVLSRWLRAACAAYYLICLKATLRRANFRDAARLTQHVMKINPWIPLSAVSNLIRRVPRLLSPTARNSPAK